MLGPLVDHAGERSALRRFLLSRSKLSCDWYRAASSGTRNGRINQVVSVAERDQPEQALADRRAQQVADVVAQHLRHRARVVE